MNRSYRVRYDISLWGDVGMHILRWTGLSIITLGIALLFYPFYFVRFLAERITIEVVVDE